MKRVVLAAAAALALGGVVVWRTWPAPPPPPPAHEKPAETARAEAFVEIAVVVPQETPELESWEDRRKLLPLIATFAPGGAGEAERFRAFADEALRDPQRCSIELMTAERYILPPAADAELVAPQLTPDERTRFFASKSVLVLRLRGPGGPPHFAYRAGFGVAAALAEQLGGFLDDEVRRRVETPALVKARMPLMDARSAFAGDAISVELDPYADAGDAARALTLGMKRFGAPDAVVEDVSMQDAASWSRALTALSEAAAAADLPASYAWPARSGAPYAVRFVTGKMASGNPENELLEVQADAATKARIARDFSQDDPLHAETEADFAARQAAVRRALPAAIARWRKDHGALFVLVDFPVPPDAVEAMWVEVQALDDAALRGTLANEPAHAPGLHHGSAVDVKKPVISGCRLELPSGEHLALP